MTDTVSGSRQSHVIRSGLSLARGRESSRSQPGQVRVQVALQAAELAEAVDPGVVDGVGVYRLHLRQEVRVALELAVRLPGPGPDEAAPVLQDVGGGGRHPREPRLGGVV